MAKRIYNGLPRLLKTPWALVAIAPTECKAVLSSLLAGGLGDYLRAWTRVDTARGMSRWHDVIDWVGGYPLEYAAPDEIFNFYRERGFALTKLLCKGVGSGCVQYVFEKSDDRRFRESESFATFSPTA